MSENEISEPSDASKSPSTQWRWLCRGLLILILLAAAFIRTAGLFRGLEEGVIFHPDAPKQVTALYNYLHDRDVWYVGSPFYDGYPLFLNRVDTWITGSLRPMVHGVAAHLDPSRSASPSVDLYNLYAWARSLRVLYGVTGILLMYHFTCRLLHSRGAGLAAAFLAAISPIDLYVAHVATGDIGVTLFLCLLFTALAWRPRAEIGQTARWFLAGAMLAGAFAAKYHGALGVIPAAAVFIGEWASRRPGRSITVLRAASASLGFGCGLITAIPPLLTQPRKTVTDIMGQASFIRNYGIDAEILERSALGQTVYALRKNTVLLLETFGWGLCLTLLAAVGLYLVMFLRRRLIKGSRLEQGALVLFPLAAGLIAAGSKPAAQPFHFAFLLPGMVFAAACLLRALWTSKPYLGPGLALVLMAALTAEPLADLRREMFFWSRRDTRTVKVLFERNTIRHPPFPGLPFAPVRSLRLEGPNLAVFRNSDTFAYLPEGDIWNRLERVPAPTVPMPGTRDWLFMNGPVLPRNDRMLFLRRGTEQSFHAVFDEQPETIRIGVRSGHSPARIDVRIGGTERRISLGVSDARIIDLPANALLFKSVGGDPANPILLLPIQARPLVGDAWITLFRTGAEAEGFRLFSGLTEAPVDLGNPEDITEDLGVVSETSLYYGENGSPVFLRDRGRAHVLLDDAPLPAGVYRFTCTIEPLGGPVSAELVVSTPGKKRHLVLPLEIPEGETVDIGHDIIKPFHPHACDMVLNVTKGGMMLRNWRLAPDIETIHRDLSSWTDQGLRPEWARRFPSDSGPPLTPAGISTVEFGSRLRLRSFAYTPELAPGDLFRATGSADWLEKAYPHFHEMYVFVHLLDGDGTQQAALNAHAGILFRGENSPPGLTVPLPETLNPGTYSVWIGVYNSRSRVRLPPRTGKQQVDNRRVRVGLLTVTPP